VQVPSPGLAELHTVNDGLLATLLAEMDVTQSAMTETEWRSAVTSWSIVPDARTGPDEPPAAPEPGDRLAQLRARGHHQLRPTLRAGHEAGSDRRVAGLIAKLGGALPWPVMPGLRLGVRDFAAGARPTLSWAESFRGGFR
jgi:hypothetical protein